VGNSTLAPSGPDPLVLTLQALAENENVGLVVKGRWRGQARGWTYLGAGRYQSDRRSEVHTSAEIQALAGPGAELTFTAVPGGTERRAGIDRDADGALDRDELDAGTDPADPRSRPRIARAQVPR
jgi:hypothetical protein